MMNWDKLTDEIIVAAKASFGSLTSAKPDEQFYAFALYTDEYAETVAPSANSIERHQAKLRATGEADKLQIASNMWAPAEWAYEYWNAEPFTKVYRSLDAHRQTLSNSEAALSSYKKSVHECMITALKRMDEGGFFAKGREGITLFISSSHDDEAFDMENDSAKRLNPELIYLPFLKRYGDDAGGAA